MVLLHNYRVGISGNINYFCSNTGTKFREPYHSNHLIPRLGDGLMFFIHFPNLYAEKTQKKSLVTEFFFVGINIQIS